MEPRGNELIQRYKENYKIPSDAHVTEQMILTHWELEKLLTQELLQSTPEKRWETFERCYTRLYSDLDWLNPLTGKTIQTSPSDRYGKWLKAIGSPPKSIYEIGSGTGEFIAYLAGNNFQCTGTEITRERGQKHLANTYPNLVWSTTDGVHLDKFEAHETFDVVLSNQVIEHLHPDDLETHMKGVLSILKGGGRYIFNTPHKYTGPHDISQVFKLSTPRGMHLREYTYQEIVASIKKAGFHHIYYAFIPRQLRTFLIHGKSNQLEQTRQAGEQYLCILLLVEKMLSIIPAHGLRSFCAKVLRKLGFFSDNIFLIAEKRINICS